MKKIIFFNSYKTWGGGEFWHHQMALFAQEKGYEPHLFAPQDSELFRRLKKEGISCTAIDPQKGSYYNPFFLFKLCRQFQEVGAESIVLNSFVDVRLAARMAKKAGISRRIVRIGTPAVPKINRVYKKSFASLTHFAAITKDIQKLFTDEAPELVRNLKSEIIYNAIELDRFSPQPEPEGEIVFGNISRLTDQKGHIWLLEALAILKKKGLSFRCLLAGEGELESELKKATSDLDLESHVEFLGFREDVAQFMASIHILSFSSKFEGSARTIVEAFASQRAVVCFDTSGMGELVQDRVNGLAVEPFSVEKFALALEEVTKDVTLRRSLAKAGREFALANCDRQKNFSRWLEFIAG